MTSVDVVVESGDWVVGLSEAQDVVSAAALAALGDRAGEVVVLLGDDGRIRELNAGFRGRDTATNVLSFPAPASAAPHLGDVILAYGACRREADEQKKPFSDHVSHLVVHGVLHLLGFDHEDDAEAEVMEAREREILARLGIGDPYAVGTIDGG